MPQKPYVFIGSSSESRDVAENIQRSLSSTCEVDIWYQDFFELGNGNIEELVIKSKRFDFAILIATCDDEINFRGEKYWAPRDNVILELGLFLGVLGVKRTFLVAEKAADKKIKLPSDLDVTIAWFERGKKQSLQGALGTATSQLSAVIRNRGCRPESYDFYPSLKVDIFHRNSGFDRIKANAFKDRLGSIGVECKVISHGAKKQPDAIFIGSHVTSGEIRAIIPGIDHKIGYIFHSLYSEADGGDFAGRKIGIGYDSDYVGAHGANIHLCRKKVTKRQLGWLIHEDTSSAEIQHFLKR